MRVKAIRLVLHVEAEEPVTLFTGKLVKTLIHAVNREIRLLHGVRGILSPIHISPLFTLGRREYELGELITPLYHISENGEHRLLPVELNGDYIVHVGGEASIVESIFKSLERILGRDLIVKMGEYLVSYRVEDMADITGTIMSKTLDSDRITLYLKGPVKPFNIYVPSRLPKFSISAYEVLAVAYLFHKGVFTVTYKEVVEAMRVLGLLVETYYSLRTVHPILVPFKGKEPALHGKITYIVDTKDERMREEIGRILGMAEIAGVGESRANGFGTVAWKPKH